MEFAEQVKAQVDIVRIVGEYVKLRRIGARYLGLCPFHTEKTPSFNVNPNIGIYKCFGCGVGGDVIKFVQEIESLTFWEALKSLAERNGIPIPERRERPDADSELRSAVFEMYQQTAQWYAQNLFGNPGADAREYLQRRGLNSTVAEQFLLGFSENGWDTLAKRFGKRYGPAEMDASGLFGKREDGGYYDKFRGRLMFPIQNEQGKVIGFGGRALKAEDEPKYLNSPETPIYKKSMVLYNLHRAKEAIRKGDRTVLVEGYMDVIGVFVAGVKNVVASCGTALTSAQIRGMKRHSENIVVNFDPDNAGANATERSVELLINEGMHMRVLELEAGLDPDEFIKKYGAEVYAEKLERSTNYFIWLADRARKKFPGTTADARMQGYEALLLPAIRRLHDPLERAAVATEVADYLNLDRNLVLAEFRKIPGQRAAPAHKSATPPSDAVPVRERMLMRTLIQHPESRPFLLSQLAGLTVSRSFVTWPVLELMLALLEEDPGFSFQALESRMEESLRPLMSQALFADTTSEVFTREQGEAFLRQLENEDRTMQFREFQRRIQAAERSGDMGEAMRLMEQATVLQRQIRASSG